MLSLFRKQPRPAELVPHIAGNDHAGSEVAIFGLRTSAPALAEAALVGWLPLLAINAYFLTRLQVELPAAQAAWRHLFEFGQMLALAFLAWGAHRILWRMEAKVGLTLAIGLLGTFSYAVLGGDLVSFLERNPETKVPWRAIFTVVTALGLMGSTVLGLLLARGSLWPVGLVLGMLVAVANQVTLPLQYPGMHLITAFISAQLIGMSGVAWFSGTKVPRQVRRTLVAMSAVALLSFVIIPGLAVRSALLASPGAVAAPFAAKLWTQVERYNHAFGFHSDASWFESRRDMREIPPDKLPGAPEDPIVILLTVDALRGDLIDEPGKSGRSVANFTRMKRKSLRFERAWSPAPYTTGSLRSLFLGTYFLQHPGGEAGQLREAEGQLAEVPNRPYLAELLSRNGVATFNVRTHEMFDNDNHRKLCPGFQDGIDLERHAPADVVISQILKRLGKKAPGPLFIYSHLFEPHAPYDQGGKKGSERDRYVAEVRRVDTQIARLRRELRNRMLHKRTYVIVTADHGEAFGEHGRNFHSTTVYEEMIRIPLLIEGPGVKARRAKEAVSLVDIPPTVLSLFGIATPAHMVGQSLVPFMGGENPKLTRPLAADGGRAIRAMLFEGRYKAMVDMNLGTEEVYDLLTDPAERKNLAEKPDKRVYITQLRMFFAGLNERKN